MEELGFELEILPADIDETRQAGEHPRDLVQRLAHEKARHVLESHGIGLDGFLLAADTIVWMGDEALGKPADAEDACRMLRELSGRTHHVSTGVSLLYQGKAGTEVREASFVETTDVTFHELTDAQIAAYARSGECSDKAGAYAIQGTGRLLVSGINGDYANVVGLPVCRVVREMAALSGDNSEQDIVERLLEVAHA